MFIYIGTAVTQKTKFFVNEEMTIEEVMKGIKLLTGYELADQRLEYQTTKTLNGMDVCMGGDPSEEPKVFLKSTLKQLKIASGSTIKVDGYSNFNQLLNNGHLTN